MIFTNKIHQLKEIIDSNILPLISEKCIYLDLPYHFNIGDTLIWEGTECFMKSNNIECLYRSSYETYEKQKVSSRTSILLHGGGNFGDIWPVHQEFRKRVIEDYPNNNIIVLPQTVYYSDINKVNKDSMLMSKHKNLTICARDNRSYSFLTTHFKENRIVLVPDMAFYIYPDNLNKYRVNSIRKTLYLKRNDKEMNNSNCYEKYIPSDSDVLDWPTINHSTVCTSFFSILSRIGKNIPNHLSYRIIDYYARYILKSHLTKEGVTFVSSYDDIYTTRLHVAILCILLNKSFNFFDNSYGKNKGFYDTWLSDLESIRFISEDA